MQIVENDLAFVRASVPELENYLLSDVLYYPITAERGRQLGGDTTQLTSGNLLLSITRIGAVDLPADQKMQFDNMLQELDRVIDQWRTHWKQKVEQEIPNRLRLWKNYIGEWGNSHQVNAGDYRYNVRLRVILELLLAETDDLLIHEKDQLHRLDMRLKSKGIPGEFVWDEAFASAFPPDPFWYLYLHF